MTDTSLMKNLTIVIPCKNEEDYIHHLIDALSWQFGMKHVKIIIADASTDNTRKVIASSKKRTKLDIDVVDGGPVSIAKNNGAEKVTTPYVCFIDADVRFWSDHVVCDSLKKIIDHDLDLIGLRMKCYDDDIRAQYAFTIFNLVNRVLSKWQPFAVGAFMMMRTDKFRELGGFPCKYPTSEDFFLSRQIDPKKFMLLNHYCGQDSRRFKKMGYFGMATYLIRNFFNRNNDEYWSKMDEEKYWS